MGPKDQSNTPQEEGCPTEETFLEEGEGAENQKSQGELANEISLMKDQLLRALAETDNLRKRALRDQEEAHKFAISAFAKELLSVADNLSRGLKSVSTEQTQGSLAPLVDGIVMTQKELEGVFERHGIREIPALGEKFDPHLHQAMLEVVDDTAVPGTVVQVM